RPGAADRLMLKHLLQTNPTLSLTRASMRIWFRDRQAIFWTFFLPVVLISVFGLLDFGAFGTLELGIVDRAGNDASRKLIREVRALGTFDISETLSEEEEREALLDGDRDLILIIERGFGEANSPVQRRVTVVYNQGQARESATGQTIIQHVLDEMSFAEGGITDRYRIEAQPVDSRNLRFIDFLMPGVVAMSIMQMGLFSVAFSFVQLKSRGILRRLQATPVHPASFIFAQVFTRLTVSILQTLVLVGLAVLAFDVHLEGNLGSMLLLALLGGGVFVSMGFAVSGFARTEDVAAPVANAIALPMMFLSGVFFPRDAMPEPLRAVADFLPLSYLADALRNVAVDGATLWSQWDNVLGLTVWLALTFFIAVRLFRWE
ncbi:MAG: ABC transporter permease, partial [Chloroflexi bacterium]|nr:ABC transporter permease [Chloroflexota bacterium]